MALDGLGDDGVYVRPGQTSVRLQGIRKGFQNVALGNEQSRRLLPHIFKKGWNRSRRADALGVDSAQGAIHPVVERRGVRKSDQLDAVSRGQNRASRPNMCSPFREFHRVLAKGVADESPGLVTNSLRARDLLLG